MQYGCGIQGNSALKLEAQPIAPFGLFFKTHPVYLWAVSKYIAGSLPGDGFVRAGEVGPERLAGHAWCTGDGEGLPSV